MAETKKRGKVPAAGVLLRGLSDTAYQSLCKYAEEHGETSVNKLIVRLINRIGNRTPVLEELLIEGGQRSQIDRFSECFEALAWADHAFNR